MHKAHERSLQRDVALKVLPRSLAVVKEVTIQGALGVTTRAYDSAIRLIESGQIALEKMHTHDFPLEQTELAIQTLAGEIDGDSSIHSCLLPDMST